MKKYIYSIIAIWFGLLSTYADNINVPNISMTPGETTTVGISLNNTEENLVSFQMDLTLPEGITINKAGCSLSDRFTDEDQELTIGRLSNGNIRLTSTSFSLTPISETSGVIIHLSLAAAANSSGGTATISNILFITDNTEQITISNASFNITTNIYATGITLNKTTHTFNAANQTVTLTATVTPANATNKNVTWTSSNTAVATVNESGVVTAVANGTATITATTADGTNHSTTCEVTVALPVPATGITLNKTSHSFNAANQTVTLTATVTPSNATNKNVTWTSSDTNVATVSGAGVVTAVADGTATITATTADGTNLSATCEVTVAIPVPATGITLNKTTHTFNAANQTVTLTATVTPTNATNKNVTWTSSDTNVATVSNTGVVTAVADGTATITATTTDGTSITATCQVTFNQCYTAYLQNVESGLFLTAANEWNTQASIDETGIPIIMEGTPESGYTLDTKIYYDATRHYLNIEDKMYCDQLAGNWFFKEISNGIYALTLDNQKYIAYDGSSSVLILSDNGNDPKAQWRLVTEEMRKAEMINATEATPLNATFLLPDANFSNENLHGNWQGSPTKNGEYANMNGEKFDTNFDVYQEITDVPNGFYVVKMQGFYREGKDEDWGVDGVVEMRKNGAEHLYAQFYVNEESMPVMSIFDEAGKNGEVGLNTELGYIPNSQSHASSYFSAGLYEHQLIVHVTDGTLRIGVRKQTEVYRDWTCFDNFRLLYYGTELHFLDFADSNVKAICVANWDTNGDGELSEAEAAAVTDLGEAFKENNEITSFDELQYFTGLTGIAEKAFNKCENLAAITLPSNITSIGSSAFDDCYALAAIDIPSSVTFIGGGAFSDCRTLTSLVLPNGITSIGRWLCNNCTGLTEMVIPNSVTTIEPNAFAGCTNIETITLPENLTSIGNYAFDGCKALTSVDIPDGVTTIGDGAFRECNSLPSLVIPNSVTSIGSWAFEKCINITSFVIPENVTTLGNGAFLNCTELLSVVIPSGITEIQGRTFEGCRKLASVTVGMTTPLTITSNTFSNRANATLIVPNGCKSAYEAASYWKEFLEIIEIGDVMENVMSTYLTNADFEGEYSVFCNLRDGADARAIYQPEGWAVSYTDGNSYDLTALNSSCLQWNNFSSRAKPENGGSNTYWIRFRWGDAESLTLSQTVTLPAGTYKLSADAFFNGASGGSATISAAGKNVSVAGNSTWSNYEVDFILFSETSVTFAFNLTQGSMVENIAGFDNFKLMYKENEVSVYNDLTVVNTQGIPGGTIRLPVSLTNEDDIVNATFHITLPKGITPVTNSNGEIQINTTSRIPEGMTILGNVDSEGVCSFAIMPSALKIASGEGEIFYFMVTASNSMVPGNYDITVDDVTLVNDVPQSIKPLPSHATLTLKEPSSGDVNGDGDTDILDATIIVYHYLGRSVGTFNEADGDINGDGDTDILDATIIVYRYLGRIPNAAPRMRVVELDPQ